ncbi:MAG TPA: DUF4835 family protein [Ferruginibacter sp.]|nr:DUF4835 family protein [Ferruginibacter sp.]HRO06293.1 DUF4835 family protein [Ferruginibacter sp.]HRO96774.1 DUF4835 family protein [Ferruginibacter sp.]HRP49823.1 DUF4835 family protein [Ferruginibacter sp.]
MRNIKLFILIFLFPAAATAQELNARVTVVHNRVSNNVNRSTFTTLQTALNNLLNTRKWTTDSYGPNEKIDCNFQLNLESTNEPNVYKALLNIQAARPVYNTSYLSPIINFQDENIMFKYVEFQQLEFNENRVTGSDALVSNLTAIFAYYAYVILAFDYNSFSLKGGIPYFQKAQNIINNAPDGRGISGWKPFEGIRNRYWLVENMLNSRYNVMHDIYYNYYRLGMDKMYEDEKAARAELMNVLNQLNSFNTENPNTMINQFFFQGKSNEWVNIFKNALPQDKVKARELLVKLDLTNANKYSEGLK